MGGTLFPAGGSGGGGRYQLRIRIRLGGWECSKLPSNKCQEHPGDRGGEAGLPPLFRVQGFEAREIRAAQDSRRVTTAVATRGPGSREDSACAREAGWGSGPGARAPGRD